MGEDEPSSTEDRITEWPESGSLVNEKAIHCFGRIGLYAPLGYAQSKIVYRLRQFNSWVSPKVCRFL